MLVLQRRPGESIWIGENIQITLLSYSRGGGRIGIKAPPEINIVREELRNQRKRVTHYEHN